MGRRPPAACLADQVSPIVTGLKRSGCGLRRLLALFLSFSISANWEALRSAWRCAAPRPWSTGFRIRQVFAAVAAQRRYMADLVDALCDEQLATPSLCAGWDVKTVAAHVISTIDDGLPTFRLAARRRSLDRAIDEARPAASRSVGVRDRLSAKDALRNNVYF